MVLVKDLVVKLSQGWAGFDPQLLHQRLSSRSVGFQSLGLSPRAIQGKHQLSPETFPERMVSDQGLQLADHRAVATASEVGFDPVLERGELQLLEADDLALCERLEGKVGERGALPGSSSGDARSQGRGGRGIVRRQRARTRAPEILESVRIDGLRFEFQDVSRGPRSELRHAAQAASEPRDGGLKGVLDALRR